MKTREKLIHALFIGALVFIQLGTVSCKGQNIKKEKSQTSTTKPDVRYKVDKEYDKQGNLIRYGSTYSYSSSSGEFTADSVFQGFGSNFSFPFHNMYSNLEFNKEDNDSLWDFEPINSNRFFKLFDGDTLFQQWEKHMLRLQSNFHYNNGEPGKNKGDDEKRKSDKS